jgi:isovaleryl-CoA dehydrogenase
LSTSSTQTPFREALAQVVADVVTPAAARVDRDGAFPTENIRALSEAGLLGLMSATDVGGAGVGLRDVAEMIEQLSAVCGSTAMIVLMHYAAVAVLEAHAPRDVREAIAAGRHLSTLAFSEAGSRSHFWAPLGTARPDGGIRLDAQKSWVTSAGHADSYVWSSLPLAAAGPMTLWLVAARSDGLSQPSGFDGFGLRGNGSTPVSASGVKVAQTALLGDDGAGLDLALSLVLPTFLALSAAFSLGLMEAVTAETAAHLTGTRLAHLDDKTLAQQQTVRMDFARMRLETDRTRALLLDTLLALETQRPDAMLRLLEVKAAAAEASLLVTDLAMKVCGGAAFRKELGIERRFRDARAARVMAPTTDALLDFIGRATLGLPLLDEVVAR